MNMKIKLSNSEDISKVVCEIAKRLQPRVV